MRPNPRAGWKKAARLFRGRQSDRPCSSLRPLTCATAFVLPCSRRSKLGQAGGRCPAFWLDDDNLHSSLASDSPPHAAMLCSSAHTAAWVLFPTRILRRMDFMWTFTVGSVIPQVRAIILL